MRDLNVTTFNNGDINQLISTASLKIPEPRSAAVTRRPAYPLLMALQKSTEKLTNFEFFEQIQQIPFSFPHGSSKSKKLSFSIDHFIIFKISDRFLHPNTKLPCSDKKAKQLEGHSRRHPYRHTLDRYLNY